MKTCLEPRAVGGTAGGGNLGCRGLPSLRKGQAQQQDHPWDLVLPDPPPGLSSRRPGLYQFRAVSSLPSRDKSPGGTATGGERAGDGQRTRGSGPDDQVADPGSQRLRTGSSGQAALHRPEPCQRSQAGQPQNGVPSPATGTSVPAQTRRGAERELLRSPVGGRACAWPPSTALQGGAELAGTLPAPLNHRQNASPAWGAAGEAGGGLSQSAV